VGVNIDASDRLTRFIARMRAELDANAVKGDWTDLPIETALHELRHHVWKLEQAARRGDQAALAEYSADVANCAMFVANSAGCLSDNTPVYRKTSFFKRLAERITEGNPYGEKDNDDGGY